MRGLPTTTPIYSRLVIQFPWPTRGGEVEQPGKLTRISREGEEPDSPIGLLELGEESGLLFGQGGRLAGVARDRVVVERRQSRRPAVRHALCLEEKTRRQTFSLGMWKTRFWSENCRTRNFTCPTAKEPKSHKSLPIQPIHCRSHSFPRRDQ